MHASNGCPGSNSAQSAHPPPAYGRSFGYLWPRTRGLLAAKEEGGVFREVTDSFTRTSERGKREKEEMREKEKERERVRERYRERK